MRAAQTFQNKTNWPLTKLGIPQPPYYPIGVKRVHVDSPNVEGTVFQTFLNYNNVLVFNVSQRAGKTNLFHMRGSQFHAENTSLFPVSWKHDCCPGHWAP